MKKASWKKFYTKLDCKISYPSVNKNQSQLRPLSILWAQRVVLSLEKLFAKTQVFLALKLSISADKFKKQKLRDNFHQADRPFKLNLKLWLVFMEEAIEFKSWSPNQIPSDQDLHIILLHNLWYSQVSNSILCNQLSRNHKLKLALNQHHLKLKFKKFKSGKFLIKNQLSNQKDLTSSSNLKNLSPSSNSNKLFSKCLKSSRSFKHLTTRCRRNTCTRSWMMSLIMTIPLRGNLRIGIMIKMMFWVSLIRVKRAYKCLVSRWWISLKR